MVLLALLLIGCVSSNISSSSRGESAAEPAPPMRRYGVVVDGYELEVSRVNSGETMGDIMISYGRTASDVDRVNRLSESIFPLRNLRAGNKYTAFLRRDEGGRRSLDYIAYERDPLHYVLFVMCGDSISVRRGDKPSQIVRQRKSAVINSSLWNSIEDSDLPYDLGVQLEDIYQWSIDLFGLQRGDSYTVIYDERFVDDSVSVNIGQIWGVKFTLSNRPYYAIPFRQDGCMSFWDESGASLKMQMLKSPLKYSRVTSRHSNIKMYYPESGVIYVAPTGTPVYSVANGVVRFKGTDDEDGGVVKIEHADGIMTGYLHLSRFARDIEVGDRVRQGDLVGYVGGAMDDIEPHLDYRVWVDGVLVDPKRVVQRPLPPISESNKAAFEALRDSIVVELDGGVVK